MYIRTEARLSKRPWGIDRKERGTLAALNEQFAVMGKTLHPTKGFRMMGVDRVRIGFITNALKTGRLQWPLQN